MSRVIGFLVLVLIVVGVIGYYQGWLSVSSAQDAGTSTVNVSLDKEKAKEAPEMAAKKIQEAGRHLKERIGGRSDSPDQ